RLPSRTPLFPSTTLFRSQVAWDFLIDLQHPRIDDAQIQPRFDGVIEKCRMHRFAHGVVAAERKRDVADAAADLRQRQVLLDPFRDRKSTRLNSSHGSISY